jgi:hypothetical protein
MTTLDDDRLSDLRRLVPPVVSPPLAEVYRRASRLRRRRTAYRATGAVGLVTAIVVAFTIVPRLADDRSTTGPVTSPPAVPELSCLTAVVTSPLPVWARTGFTPPDQAIAHVTGSKGDIVGVLFGGLHAPTAAGEGNKILWVARVSGGAGDPDLKIHATLDGSDVAVDRVVTGGPGPSLVDVPQAGCWTFTLSWSGHEEQVALPYS